MSRAKVCHITTVHDSQDTRILHRECVSLAEHGFEVHLIVANQTSFSHKGVQVHSIQAPYQNRLQRMRQVPWAAYQKAKTIDADLYHFHDPELLPVGYRLHRDGKPAIYDIHEHVPHQLRTKSYLPRPLRPLIATTFERYENYMARRMDALITATDLVRDRFLPLNARTVSVNNYPRLDTLYVAEEGKEKAYQVTYVGLMNEIRGIRPLLEALAMPGDWRLTLVGYFESQELEQELRRHPGWQRVDFLGRKSRTEVADILAASQIGLVTFLPAPNHNRNQPNKLFEYMAAGLPVVCSNLERWAEIVQQAQCGLLVDPAKPGDIDGAVVRLLGDPAGAKQLGINGRTAMEAEYNWSSEEQKLIALYESLLSHA